MNFNSFFNPRRQKNPAGADVPTGKILFNLEVSFYKWKFDDFVEFLRQVYVGGFGRDDFRASDCDRCVLENRAVCHDALHEAFDVRVACVLSGVIIRYVHRVAVRFREIER